MYGSPSPLLESAGMWRYFTSTFLHIGFEHLLFNCFALYKFAPPLERMLGAVKYAIFYMGSGYIGSLASDVFHTSNYVSAGASGAVYGIYAAYLFLALFRKHVLDEQSSKVITIIIIMGVVYSIIVPHVNLLAHLGGFLGGAILFALLGYSIGRNRRIG
jgi:membrane associated rhomboid family serine protease